MRRSWLLKSHTKLRTELNRSVISGSSPTVVFTRCHAHSRCKMLSAVGIEGSEQHVFAEALKSPTD